MSEIKPADYILDEFLAERGVRVPFDEAQEFLGNLREAFRQEEEYGIFTMAEAKTLAVAVQEFADRHGIELEGTDED